MARYDYICTKCKEIHEVEKKMKETARKELCPKCGSEMDRVYTVTPFHLKGGGWFKDKFDKK